MNRKDRRAAEVRLRKAQSAQAFCAARDAILRKLDVPALETFMRANGQAVPKYETPKVPYAMMHKARLLIRNFTPEEKLESAKWLVENDFEIPPPMELVDGVLIGAEYQQ